MKSIRTKVWVSFISFTVFLLAVIWIMQVAFLDYYYEEGKKDQVETVANVVEDYIEDNVLIRHIRELEKTAFDNNLCIDLRSFKSGNSVLTLDMLGNECLIHGNIGFQNQFRQVLIDFMQSGEKEYVTTMRDSKFSKKNMLLLRQINGDNDNYLLVINAQVEPVAGTAQILANHLLMVTVVLLIVSSIGSLIIARRMTGPITEVSSAARKFAEGDFDVRVNVSLDDEVGELGTNFNYLADEVNKVEKTRNALFASVSHDLRTPITMIKGYAEMLRDLTGENPEKREQQLNIIIDEADRLTYLINDMLVSTRLKNDLEEENDVIFDLSEQAQKIVEHYQVIEEKANFTLSLEAPEHAYVCGDVDRITQVIYNLINNAINHIGDDRVVQFSIVPAGKVYRVEVCDRGDGIAPEHLPLIWDRYYRVNKSGKRREVGTGLGLSIVKQILQKANCAFGVESVVGEGTKFWFEMDKVKHRDKNKNLAQNNTQENNSQDNPLEE